MREAQLNDVGMKSFSLSHQLSLTEPIRLTMFYEKKINNDQNYYVKLLGF